VFFALSWCNRPPFRVFVSLDLILYYGFWELSLVPMAILIAMYGRKDGPRAALKFFSSPSSPPHRCWWRFCGFMHGPAALTIERCRLDCARKLSAYRWLGGSGVSFRICRQGSGLPLHGWLADTFSEAPVLGDGGGRQAGLYSMLRFHIGSSRCRRELWAPVLVGLAVVGILYGAAWRWCSATSGG